MLLKNFESIPPREEIVDLDGVPVNVKSWGTWIEDPLVTKEVVVVIPGAVGLVHFYAKFLSTLYFKTGCNVPVWIIGHAGCDETPKGDLDIPPLKGNEHLYNLEAQIQYKLKFIRKYVPEDVKIHLIGHSAGGYMVTQLLKYPDIKAKAKKVYLLFPTLERVKESPNSKWITHCCLPLYSIIQFLLILFSVLPYFLQAFFIHIYMLVVGCDKYHLNAIIMFLRRNTCNMAIYLAKQEIDKVKELDVQLLRENSKLITLYYGTTDGWVPVKYYHELVERIPEINAILDDQKMSHIFVFNSSYEMGKIMGEFIRTDLDLYSKQIK